MTSAIEHFSCNNEDKPFLEDPEPVDQARAVLGDKIEACKAAFREGHDFVDARDRKN